MEVDKIMHAIKIESNFSLVTLRQINSILAGTSTEYAMISRHTAQNMLIQQSTSQSLYSARDKIMSRLLTSISSDQPSLRQKSIKSFQEIISEDSTLMESNIIFTPIQIRLLDSTIIVRDATVDLIWKIMSSSFDDAIIEKYYSILGDRIMVNSESFY